MKSFEIGKSYVYRFACSWDTKVVCKIVKRTAKTVTFVDELGKTKSCRIRVYDDCEHCSPEGRYSMSPVLCADKLA